ncbi:MAG: hypothetical protein KGH63_04010, partial [Candidatus Micrarchaeota archaeon]|nr:hypothetical protein [Candidatus Micrarchaeota archaeon]
RPALMSANSQAERVTAIRRHLIFKGIGDAVEVGKRAWKGQDGLRMLENGPKGAQGPEERRRPKPGGDLQKPKMPARTSISRRKAGAFVCRRATVENRLINPIAEPTSKKNGGVHNGL